MAARRRTQSSRSSSRSGSSRSDSSPAPRSSSRASSRRPASNNNTVPMIMAGVVLVGIIAVAIFALGGKDKPKEDTPKAPAQAKTVAPAPRARSSRSSGKAGKKPDRPAPRIDAAQLAKARAYLKEGKAIYNRVMADFKAGKGAIDHAKLQECKAVLEKGRRLFDALTEWDEEATMEGWAYPSHAIDDMALWGKLSKIYAKAHKLSRAK